MSGALAVPSSVVFEAVQARMGAVTTCYDEARGSSPDLAGRMVVDLRCIEGRCIAVRVVEDGVGDAALSACVVGELTGLALPTGHGEVLVRFPLVFAAAAGAAEAPPP